MRKLRTIIGSVLGVAMIAGTVALATGPASAVPRTCTSGTTGWFVYHRQPGELDTWFVSGSAGISRPSQCMQLRPEVTWQDSFGTHHAYGGWITTQQPTHSDVKTDGPGLLSARQERQWTNGTHRECRKIYPNAPPNTHWSPCTG